MLDVLFWGLKASSTSFYRGLGKMNFNFWSKKYLNFSVVIFCQFLVIRTLDPDRFFSSSFWSKLQFTQYCIRAVDPDWVNPDPEQAFQVDPDPPHSILYPRRRSPGRGRESAAAGQPGVSGVRRLLQHLQLPPRRSHALRARHECKFKKIV